MKFGLSGCGAGLEAVAPERLGEYAQWAERLGFEALWINEEHFQKPSGGSGRLCLSPVVLAAVLAAGTSRIRLGFSVLLLPLHHPIRLAEEIATLDVLCGGRVDVGISRGGNPSYSEAYGLDPQEGRTRFDEDLDLVLRCWTEDEVPIGKSRYCILPKPMQRPHPPLYIGTYSEDRARWAARAGHQLIQHGIQSMANVQRMVRAFGDEGGKVHEIPVGRFLYVSESDADAAHELTPVIERLTGRLKQARIPERPGTLTIDDLEPERFLREMVIAGGPDTCAQRLAELRGLLGIDYVNCLSSFFGFLPADHLRRSLMLLSREVMPRMSTHQPGAANPT
ncbi:MAG: LLM class flavin-dependent oxidoreductase [Nitrospiraceae bacterium]